MCHWAKLRRLHLRRSVRSLQTGQDYVDESCTAPRRTALQKKVNNLHPMMSCCVGCGATVHQGANYIGQWAAVTSADCGSWVDADSYWEDNSKFDSNAVKSIKVLGAGCSLAVATGTGGGGTNLELSEGAHNDPLDAAVLNSIKSVKLICPSQLPAQPHPRCLATLHNMPPRHFAESRPLSLHGLRGLTHSRVLQGHVQKWGDMRRSSAKPKGMSSTAANAELHAMVPLFSQSVMTGSFQTGAG